MKQKTKKSAAKRFKLTGTGKIKRHSSHASHILTKKSPKRKRKLRKGKLVADGDQKRVLRMLKLK
ncbi:MAG TPA: 50S ribosomal protein L35 [Acidobacteriota bacterium]|nr:50S ribosomal protein L35 [Acidobacteriota bacterium]